MADHPAGVTVKALVLDAVARMPSGWGSKSDVVLSVQLSQYVRSDVPDKALQHGA